MKLNNYRSSCWSGGVFFRLTVQSKAAAVAVSECKSIAWLDVVWQKWGAAVQGEGSLPWIPGAPSDSRLEKQKARQGVHGRGHGWWNQPAGGCREGKLWGGHQQNPTAASGLCQADTGELAREGSDPVVPTLGRDNAQFPAVSASDNPIIPSLFFQSLFEPVTHYKQNVFVLFLTAKLWNNKGLGEELPTCVFLQGLQQLHFHQSSALFLNKG